LKILFGGQIRNSRTPFIIGDWSSKKVLPERQWQEIIEAKVKKCNMLIELVGKKASGASGIVKEIAFALELVKARDAKIGVRPQITHPWSIPSVHISS
jgi:hypothetical protein